MCSLTLTLFKVRVVNSNCTLYLFKYIAARRYHNYALRITNYALEYESDVFVIIKLRHCKAAVVSYYTKDREGDLKTIFGRFNKK